MAPPAQSPAAVRFGEFELDLRTGELQRNGQKIQLPPRVFELLAALLERPGEVVTREQLHGKLWTNTYVEFDDNLNHAVRKLRETLNDSADQPRFVETLPRQGYRFVSPVELIEAPPGSEAGAAAATSRFFRAKYKWLAVAIVLVAVGSFLAWNYGWRARGRVLLAVLPLENLTGDEEQDYLSDGLTDEIITELGRMNPDRLGVIARTSTLRYKQTRKNIAEIGHELGVEYVLEGSVRRASPQLRLTLQLIRVSDQTHLWAEAYELSTPGDTAVQKDAAARVAGVLAIELSPSPQKRLDVGRRPAPEAREAYLRGRYWMTKGTGPDIAKGEQYFQQAIAAEPAYAEAYAGLATSYHLLGNYDMFPISEMRPKAKAAATRALELDPNLVDAHLALAGLMMEHEWDFAGAQRELQAAVQSNPNSAWAHQWYASLLEALGQFDQAIEEMKKAYELDPLSLRTGVDLGRAYYFARRHDLAITQYRKVLELNPDFSGAHSMLGLALLEKRDYGESIAELEKGVALLPQSAGYSVWLGYAYARAGRKADAKKMLAIQVEYRAQKPHLAAEAIALTHSGMGDKDEAFAWLETAYQERAAGMTMIKAFPYWDSLRPDPRFQELVRRVGLPGD